MHALVVEDNAANFFLISRLLESHGFHCEWKLQGSKSSTSLMNWKTWI